MATKLKNMKLTSVDLVRSGANQEADICLFKSADDPATQPREHETGIFKRFLKWLRENPDENPEDTITKDCTTFDQINDNRENEEKLWRYTDALNTSIRSICQDDDLDRDGKASMMLTSLRQFSDAMEELIQQLAGAAPGKDAPMMSAKSAPDYEQIEEIDTKKA